MNNSEFLDLYNKVYGQDVPIPPEIDLADVPPLKMIYDNCHTSLMNQIILVSGLPRTGKTELCLDGAYAIDRDKEGNHLFRPETHIATNLEELTHLIDKEKRAGANIVWEEAGVSGKGAGARDWQNEENKLVGNIFQIMGLKRLIVWINLPWNFFLDKGPRSLTHCGVFTKRIDKRLMRCKARFRILAHIPEKGEVRYIRPRYFRNGRLWVNNYSYWPRAPLEIRQKYYEIQKGYKPQWISEFKEAIKLIRESKKDEAMDMGALLEEIKMEPDLYWDYEKGKPDVQVMHIKLKNPTNNKSLSLPKCRALAKAWVKDGGV